MADADVTWERIEPTTVTKVGWRTVVTKTFKMPDGSVMAWDTKEPENSQTVATLALTTDNKVIVAYQFRPGAEVGMYELPGGGIDPGEDLEVAARRELLEETGYAPQDMQYLGKARIDAHSNNLSHFYLATGCTTDGAALHVEAGEFTQPRLITVSELFAHAQNALVTDVPALFLAYEKLIKLKENA